MDSKKRTTNRVRLKTAFVLSLLIHATLVGLLWYAFQDVLRPAGEGDFAFVAVSLVSEPKLGASGTTASELDKHDQPLPSLDGRGPKGRVITPSSILPHQGGGSSEGGEGGTSEILRQIRTKIERAKFYPLMAKRQNIEGAPVVEFQIQNDGSVQNVQLKQTSGSEILDEAAVQTVRQASPLPFYPDPISLSIRYALSGKP